MLIRSLAVRLDFDMRILPSSIIALIICAFTQMLVAMAQSVIGLGDLPTLCIEQTHLRFAPAHQLL